LVAECVTDTVTDAVRDEVPCVAEWEVVGKEAVTLGVMVAWVLEAVGESVIL